MPLVSVIVTTYNRKNLLTVTLNSILNQTFQDFELIVVDNFSNYDFFSHIDSFKSVKIIPFQNANNGVIAINRNYGLQHVKGKYVAFCDDDDVWYLNKLEKQLAILEQSGNSEDYKLVYSEVMLFGEGITEAISNRKAVKDIDDLIKRNQISLSSTLMTKSNLLEFDEDPILLASEDYALWLKLLGKGYLPVYISEPLVRYRVSANSAFETTKGMFRVKNVYTLIKHVLKQGTSGISLSRYLYSIFIELLRFYFKR
jgi:glycosyltransferase involved in cell wall biosynthesis